MQSLRYSRGVLFCSLYHTAYFLQPTLLSICYNKKFQIYTKVGEIYYYNHFLKPVEKFLSEGNLKSLKQTNKKPYVLTMCRTLYAGPEDTNVSVLKELIIQSRETEYE